MLIGIIGLGFVGTAILESLKKKDVSTVVYDKFKDGGIGSLDDCLDADLIFLCLPTVYDYNINNYNLQPTEENLEILNNRNYKGLLVNKSTVIPGTTEKLSQKYDNLNLCHNPEFLTAATANEDFYDQRHIVLGKTESCSNFELVEKFYRKYWPEARISKCSSDESEAMKLGCNCFYSVKIQFFNELYLMCQKQNMDYNKVKDMMIGNDWINSMHTKVPGTDGKLSYGGFCFPKDTNALNSHLKRLKLPNMVMNATIEERNLMRKDNANIILKDDVDKELNL